ncbi:NADP-dependent oxidoreductase domain-containing protein [Dissophora ornata]|nr:NADP-dependent oxidoreductase domain-containing protein [Dissophora ornata]
MLPLISMHAARQCQATRVASGHVLMRQAFRQIPSDHVRQHRIFLAVRSFNNSATPDATAAFLAKHPALPTATIPKRGLVLSKLGFGAYRVNDSQPAHRAALVKAIQAGVNVIDTSSHFGHGASETFVGNTLQDLFKQDKIKREQVVVVSKAGFILPPPLSTTTTTTASSSSMKDSLESVPSYAKISDSSYHSIHPSYLKSQITASLERLKLEKLDIFMLNNPERMLGDNHLPGGFSKSRLYKEIAEAFVYLDEEVAEGRIGGYGICSNALHMPTTEDHLSLKAIVKTRQDFGWKSENFVAIQVPLNLFEREAVTDVFPAKSLAREAKEFNIFMFTNRPLNAIAGGQIVTLENKGQHSRQEKSAKLLETLDLSFTSLAEMELDIKDMIEEESLALKFVWSEVLSENLSRLSSNYFAAKHFLEREVLPAIDRDLKFLEDSTKGPDQDRDDKDAILSWIDRYRKEAKSLTTDISAFCQLDSDKRNDELNLVLGLVCRDFVSDVGPHKVENIGSPLSTKSIQFCTAHENVGCTLVGMRTPEYVYDAVAAAEASKRLTKTDLELISQCPLLLTTSDQ